MNMKLSLPPYQAQSAVLAHKQMADHLEQLILKGTLPPSTRLPPATELAREWNASYVVVHRALAQLTRTGLLERRPQRGTFVRQWQRESVIGILMDPSLNWESAHFYRRLTEVLQTEIPRMGLPSGSEEKQTPAAARNGARSGHFRCRWISRVYDGLAPLVQGQPGFEQVCQRLRDDLEHFPFRGWINVGVGVDQMPFGEQIRKLPMAHARYDAFSDIAADDYDFTYQTVKHLAQHGCKRISYLRLDPAKAAERKGLEDAAREHGVKAQIVPFDCPHRAGRSPAEAFFIQERETTEFTVQLVERWRRTRQWPDGLIVWEDIGMRAVALGLFKAGVEVPGQLRVVSQANEGIYHNYAVPVARYETPVTEIARQLVRILWRRMNHEDPGPLPVVLRGKVVPEAEKVIA